MLQAINAYYSCALYGLITENSDMQQFSQLLMAMEVQSVRKYWHIADFSIYDEVLGSSSRMIGEDD
jgi:endoglucanase Acf2